MSDPANEFLGIFHDEAAERLDRIAAVLIAVESGKAPPDAVESLFRDVHTIKGAAGLVGLDRVQALAHAMEDVLADARESGTFPSELVEPLIRSTDALRDEVEGRDAETGEIIEQLAQSAGGESGNGSSEPAATAAPTTSADKRSIRVLPEKIDALLDLVGETVLHRRRLEYTLGEELTRSNREVADELDFGERLFDGLKDTALAMRTLPLSSVAGTLPRAVRDLAIETGKEVELVVSGAETELDRAILEGLPELLGHLLRNAIAHGIEPPDERERLGKQPRGRVELRAEQRGAVVEVTVSDDGRGVPKRALNKATGPASLAEVLAEAGFSTASEVSEISGRGVGLNAVKKQVELIGGSVEVHSDPGKGTAVVMRLPLVLALIQVLLVERAGNVYGLPLTSVEEAISLDSSLSLAGRPALDLRGHSVPLTDLAELLGNANVPRAASASAVVLYSSGEKVAVICDKLLGKDEVVVKSLGPLLKSLKPYLGAAILGDGRIALLVDPAVLVHLRSGISSTAAEIKTADEQDFTPKVLIVEDSFTVRELQRNILEAAGYRVATACDGRQALLCLERDDDVGLVLTDVEMPEMDGIELTEAIRGDGKRSTLPVVILTSLEGDDTEQRGIEAGADAYIVKSKFDQQALLETVERLVGR